VKSTAVICVTIPSGRETEGRSVVVVPSRFVITGYS
jgi:hypothetical protein